MCVSDESDLGLQSNIVGVYGNHLFSYIWLTTYYLYYTPTPTRSKQYVQCTTSMIHHISDAQFESSDLGVRIANVTRTEQPSNGGGADQLIIIAYTATYFVSNPAAMLMEGVCVWGMRRRESGKLEAV